MIAKTEKTGLVYNHQNFKELVFHLKKFCLDGIKTIYKKKKLVANSLLFAPKVFC